ncbi:hypothetical protein FEA48_02605 [Pseudomonas nitroreducens]|uniref:Uncharacterized protein n=1 Tax=Pseudomonas nitroreducens TaxID=46680 RepID=A0A5R9AHP0_PSENT|nr:hypothetical protein [Pseudomonas nitroreducens]TLP78103.1 hypothetical protein FEA48_02605 [Pseudomonas nitroreducens]
MKLDRDDAPQYFKRKHQSTGAWGAAVTIDAASTTLGGYGPEQRPSSPLEQLITPPIPSNYQQSAIWIDVWGVAAHIFAGQTLKEIKPLMHQLASTTNFDKSVTANSEAGLNSSSKKSLSRGEIVKIEVKNSSLNILSSAIARHQHL